MQKLFALLAIVSLISVGCAQEYNYDEGSAQMDTENQDNGVEIQQTDVEVQTQEGSLNNEEEMNGEGSISMSLDQEDKQNGEGSGSAHSQGETDLENGNQGEDNNYGLADQEMENNDLQATYDEEPQAVQNDEFNGEAMNDQVNEMANTNEFSDEAPQATTDEFSNVTPQATNEYSDEFPQATTEEVSNEIPQTNEFTNEDQSNNYNSEVESQTSVDAVEASNAAPSGKCIVMYSQCNYAGQSVEVCGNLEKLKNFNEPIKSIYVPEGLSISIFDKANFQGQKHTFAASQECLFEPVFVQLEANNFIQMEASNFIEVEAAEPLVNNDKFLRY